MVCVLDPLGNMLTYPPLPPSLWGKSSQFAKKHNGTIRKITNKKETQIDVDFHLGFFWTISLIHDSVLRQNLHFARTEKEVLEIAPAKNLVL